MIRDISFREKPYALHDLGQSFRGFRGGHEELAKAGVLVDGNGLHPTAKGWRLRYTDGKRLLIDGPFAETKEVIAGYTMIKVKTPEEALHWFQRFPQPHYEDCEIELRQMFELDELGDGEQIDRFREMEVGVKGSEPA